MNGLYDEFRIAVHHVWQRRWLALAVAWGVCLLGWLAVATIPNVYESKARVFVEMQSVLPDQVAGNRPSDRRDQLERVQQTLTSTDNLEKVVRATALGDTVASPRELENAAEGLRKSIEVVSQDDNLFEITATASRGNLSDSENAKLARDIVQKMIDIFVEANLAGGRGEMSEALKFLDTQLAERQRELDAADQKRVAFETQNLGLLPGQGSISARISAGRSEINQIESQLVSAQSALAAINGQLAGTPQTIAGGAVSNGSASSQLRAAEVELASARSKGWTDAHPDVIALKSRIANLRQQAADEPSGSGGIPNPAYSSLISIKAERQANVAALSARKQSLEADLAQLQAKQTAEPEVMAELAKINRDYDVLKQQYDKLLADREQIRLQGQVQTETDAVNFKVIERPNVPRAPAEPNRPLLLAFVLVAGIGAGVGAAFGVSQLKTTYPTAARLERAAGLPVLGSISQMLTSEQRVERRRKLRLFVGAGAALGAVFVVLLAIEFIQRGMLA